jgi:flagellar hook protein FlgE
MLRSLNAGVSGLTNQQIQLDIIGNNIANVNTNGYKSQRVTFQEQFAETLKGGAAPQGNLGGTNPAQIGLGVKVGSIDTVQTQGTLNPTGKNTDLAVSGNGFFVLSDGQTTSYTRDGAFDFDRNGNFIKTSNGFRVQGWNAQPGPNGTVTINSAQPVQPIVVPAGTTIPPQATQNIRLNGNLEALTPSNPNPGRFVGVPTPTAPPGLVANSSANVSVQLFDSQGNPLKGQLQFTKVQSVTQPVAALGLPAQSLSAWKVDFFPVDTTSFTGLTPTTGATVGYVEFTNSGQLAGYVPSGSDPAIAAPTSTLPSVGLTSQATGTPQTVSFNLGTPGQQGAMTNYADPQTNIAKAFYSQTPNMMDQDGYTAGSLTGVTVDPTGTMNGIFSNGRTRVLAQVAMAAFTNPAGLSQEGGNLFKNTPNSGEAQIGTASTGLRGTITPGALENSNVDLAAEFSNMIIAQRGLQSNSKIITTADEVLQELMNLKH